MSVNAYPFPGPFDSKIQKIEERADLIRSSIEDSPICDTRQEILAECERATERLRRAKQAARLADQAKRAAYNEAAAKSETSRRRWARVLLLSSFVLPAALVLGLLFCWVLS